MRLADTPESDGTPRHIPAEAVARVRGSIEKYGYQNPLVVTPSGEIVAGHTRYRALRALGAEGVDVIVTDMPEPLAREYRVVDNRSGEFTSWDPELLLAELREFGDADAVQVYFPEIDLSLSAAGPLDLDGAQDGLDGMLSSGPDQTTREVTCPNCGAVFTVSGA